ncbi:MAG: hypothetical protein FJW20_11815 [Acidimicrobiia bacterium]|nr:hypothetical protein [Acidimicrobiia bacterium]
MRFGPLLLLLCRLSFGQGVITTAAGTDPYIPPVSGINGEDVRFDASGNVQLAADGQGNVYLSSPTLCQVIRLTPSGRADTVAGNGICGTAGTEIAAVESQAEKALRTITFHHTSYGIAQVRARLGDAPRALRWLQITVDTGWPSYLMMARDRMLDPVRNDPSVARFLAALKQTWENDAREFGEGDK